jgi:uncharacterized protein YeeX (DUF496 family)
MEATTKARLLAGAGLAVVLALAGPFLWALASAGVALWVILVVGLGLAALVRSIPLLGQKLENRLLAARKAEARENPIEQHQNAAKREAARIQAYENATKTIRAQIDGLRDMVTQQRKVDPSYDFQRTERGIAAMEAAYESRIQTIKNAKMKLEEFKREIQREIFEFEAAKAMQATNGLLSPQDEARIMDDILNNEASRAIRESFNTAVAELDLEVRTLNDAKQLSFDGGLTLDVSAIRIPDLQKVS